MPKTVMVERTLYSYDELSEKAKERAREKWCERAGQDWTWEWVYEDTDQVCSCLGIELDRKPVRLHGGGTRQEPCIWFSGFWSQGDGACFEGKYYGVANHLESLHTHAPNDADLDKIATTLDELQAKYGGKLRAVFKHSGHYYHQYCTDFDVELDEHDEDWSIPEADEKELISAIRNLMAWTYEKLEAEYDHQTSTESAEEALRDGVTFDASGNRLDEDDL